MSENESSVKHPMRSADARQNGPRPRGSEEALRPGSPSRAVVSRLSVATLHAAGGGFQIHRMKAVPRHCVAAVTGSVRGDISRAGRGAGGTIVPTPGSDRPAPDVSPEVNAGFAGKYRACTGAGRAPLRARPGSWKGREATRGDGRPVTPVTGGALGTSGRLPAVKTAWSCPITPCRPVLSTGGDS